MVLACSRKLFTVRDSISSIAQIALRSKNLCRDRSDLISHPSRRSSFSPSLYLCSHLWSQLVIPLSSDGKLLLGRKLRGFGEGFWNGFGGKVGHGESIVEAAVREVRWEDNNSCIYGKRMFKWSSFVIVRDLYPSRLLIYVWRGRRMDCSISRPLDSCLVSLLCLGWNQIIIPIQTIAFGSAPNMVISILPTSRIPVCSCTKNVAFM